MTAAGPAARTLPSPGRASSQARLVAARCGPDDERHPGTSGPGRIPRHALDVPALAAPGNGGASQEHGASGPGTLRDPRCSLQLFRSNTIELSLLTAYELRSRPCRSILWWFDFQLYFQLPPRSMRSSKEVYPNAPLQLVAFEIRHPTIRRVFTESGLDALQTRLQADFPIFESIKENALTIGPQGAQGTSSLWYRFLSKSKRVAISVRPRRLVVETTDYERYEKFRETIGLALTALVDADRIPVFERIGLRYLDEIRVEVPIEKPSDWTPFVQESLLQPLSLEPSGSTRARIEGVLRFVIGPPHEVIVRYGTLEGEVVGDGPLRLKANKVRKGPFFLIDIDSFVVAQDDQDEFAPELVLKICDRLREPVREVFESCITDRLRHEVLRRKS